MEQAKNQEIKEITIRLSKNDYKKVVEKSEQLGLKPTSYTKMVLVKSIKE